MPNATGLRDQMLRLYARSNAGRGCTVRPVFTFTAEWWGRVDTLTSSTHSAQDKLQLKFDAQAQFADECTVPANGVLKDESGTLWWLRGIVKIRATRTLLVGLDRIDEELAKTFTLYEGASTLDGVHLLDTTP